MDELISKIEKLSLRIAENFYSTVKVLNNLQIHTERYYEGSHSRYLAEKSEMVAREIGLNEGEVMEIKIAALLHDIGKIGFTDAALFKAPNEMIANELSQYLLHPEVGFYLLQQHKDFNRISYLVYQHHERLDGTGFPRHLKGDDIFLGARIISIVDYFHNHVFKLSRKQAASGGINAHYSTAAFLEDSGERYYSGLEFLRKKAGILFDKRIVEVFTHIVELERKQISSKNVTRLGYTSLESGMILAEDYRTKYGMLIAAKGETVSQEMIKAMARFVQSGDLPSRLLVMR